ncbi:clavaminate synthase [Raphidocelis subcapitata]|uniref:Clavaminate synthase n=1 Tax=Raphidocelis subcapitata TaxID=307507 RepID=A0A2V0PJR7_9CHLO|nr:clavaminate synthase [Raphidocelis subcapitata]|eukprot:GBF98150.1 clavaminate synthase [Raphidocelis subcapitata]
MPAPLAAAAAAAAAAPAPAFDAAAVRALAPREQGAVEPYAPVVGRQAWLASDFSGPEDWTIQLSPQHIAELEAAIAAVLATGRVRADGNNLEGLSSVTEADAAAHLPTLAPLLRAARAEVLSGRGFALLRRLPVERWSREQALVAYWILGHHWGVPMEQNERRHVIGHVKDVGVDPYLSNPNTRIYMTRAAQPWHVDSSDLVALLCLAEAKEGGNSGWASSMAIINTIREEAPELLPVLAGPWFLDRKGEVGPGEAPVFHMPILMYHQGHALVALHDSYYQLASDKWGGPAELSPLQLRALEKFREVADRPGVAIRTRLAPGDVQLLNNHTQIHMRSAYRDWEGEDGAQRHLLRLWLAVPPPDAVPLPDCFKHLWKRFAGPHRGLTRGANGRWAFPEGQRAPLEAEVGQAHIPEAASLPRAR